MLALIFADEDVIFILTLRNESRKYEAEKERCYQTCKYFFASHILSYVRPGTRFDLTCSQFDRTKKRRENNMFHCNKVTLEVPSQLINEDLVTSV